jgi:hypothetical protein
MNKPSAIGSISNKRSSSKLEIGGLFAFTRRTATEKSEPRPRLLLHQAMQYYHNHAIKLKTQSLDAVHIDLLSIPSVTLYAKTTPSMRRFYFYKLPDYQARSLAILPHERPEQEE